MLISPETGQRTSRDHGAVARSPDWIRHVHQGCLAARRCTGGRGGRQCRTPAGAGEARRRGAVVGMSGGIDSSVVAALCVRALGPERVFGLLMPERDSSDDALRLGRLLAEHLGIRHAVEDIAPALEGLGCYRRQLEAIRMVGPGVRRGLALQAHPPRRCWRGPAQHHQRSPWPIRRASRAPSRMTPAAYLQIVAATNFKQRTRKMMEYYHADRLNYAVAGTPNLLEYDQGFFVKQGDGAADFKPIAHLYKTQVYALAEHLGVPEEIRRRPPTTDTFSLAQTQEEFYFALPYGEMDLCLWAHNHGVPAAEVAAGRSASRPSRSSASTRTSRPSAAPARYLHRAPLLVGAAGAGSHVRDRRDRRARRRRAPPDARGAGGDGRRAPPPRPGRVRDLPRRAAPASVTPGSPSSTWPPASSRSANEDGTLWVVFNGEIFNYLELREELVAPRPPLPDPQRHRGHRPRLGGLGGARPSRGSTGSSPWRSGTRARETLVLSRDRLGVRPHLPVRARGPALVRERGEGDLRRATRPPARARPGRPGARPSPSGRWCLPSRSSAGVTELEPGHVRVVSPARRGGPGVLDAALPGRRDGAPSPARSTEAAERSRAALEEAVRLRMLRADVPVGCYLSGGLDSSLVAALGRRVKGDGFCTFSLRFEDAEYDETPYQRAVAAASAATTARSWCGARDIAEAFPEVVAHAERPLLRTAPAPLFLLSRLVRESGHQGGPHRRGRRRDVRRLRPLPRGEGAALLGPRSPASTLPARASWSGSTPTWPARRWRSRPWPASSSGADRERWAEPGVRPRHALASGGGAAAALPARGARAPPGASTWSPGCSATLPGTFRRWSSLAQDQYLEVRTLLSGYLLSSQGDRMLMAPLGGGALPVPRRERGRARELAARRPTSCAVLDEKHVLKRAAEGLVPDEILRRPKQPYRAPDALCFVGPRAPEWVAEVMASGAVPRPGCSIRRAVGALEEVPGARRRRAVLERRQHGPGRRALHRALAPNRSFTGHRNGLLAPITFKTTGRIASA